MNRRLWELQYAGSPKTLWSEVRPTEAQLAIAASLDIQVSTDDTFARVAAAILEAIGDVIGCPSRDISDRQLELAEELGVDLSDCKSSSVAFVRIQEAIQLANLAAVRRMELKPGDRVIQSVDRSLDRLEEMLGDIFEVSSIREDGQVFFKEGSEQAPARYLDKLTTTD